ncbi:MAG: hypothetical protein IJB59_04125 [Oscillospiraceae bacterium]|nr:hypothetical protein [Oscillospiraceae bacterium]
MDILVKLTVSNTIYRFYREASAHIADSSPEDVMSDALTAYAGLLSQDISRQLQVCQEENGGFLPGNSSQSRSR